MKISKEAKRTSRQLFKACLKDGQLEYQHRRDAASSKIDVADAFTFLKGKLAL